MNVTLTRRDFLKVAGGAATVATMMSLGLDAAAAPAKKRDLKKGLWYAAAPGETALEKFKSVKAAGFDGIEPPSHLDQEEILRARDATGLAIPSVSCG